MSNKATSTIWHHRLGHASSHILQFLNNKDFINVSKWNKQGTICSFCQMGKNCKLPFSNSTISTMHPLEKLHCDLWGPAPMSDRVSLLPSPPKLTPTTKPYNFTFTDLYLYPYLGFI